MTLSRKDVSKLRLYTICPKKARKEFLKKLKKSEVKAICECVINTLRGNIQLKSNDLKKLRKYKNTLRSLASKKQPLYKKKHLIVQHGGFLSTLLPIAVSLIGSLLMK
jgi:hypothetical protein